jgi:hypothetical protein
MAEAVDVTRMCRRATGVVVVNVNDLRPPGIAMFLADRVIKVEVDFFSLTTFLALLDGEGDCALSNSENNLNYMERK